MRVANKDVGSEVADKREFKGSSMWGEWTGDNKLYVVFSYGQHFPMYAYDQEMNEWVGNKDKYSRSTTRHQSQARPPLDEPIMWLGTSEMQKLVRMGGISQYVFNA
jgi:hypothetical protein